MVIVERDADRCAELTDRYIASVIEGDATRPSVLRQADPEQSDVIASVIGDTGTNIGVCAVATQLASDIHTVARIDHGETDDYGEVVDRVVFPEKLAAHVTTNEILDVSGGGVRTVEAVTDALELIEITVAEGAPAAGERLESVSFPRGADASEIRTTLE
ncbi:MAG: NAD-binding protein, partial [Salinirussus sp.]